MHTTHFQSSCPGLSRVSTAIRHASIWPNRVDGRDKPGHDVLLRDVSFANSGSP